MVQDSDANAGLDRLLSEARQLDRDYDEALERYGQGIESSKLLAGLAIDYLDIPEEVSSPGLKLFLRRWESTPEYKTLLARFEGLYDRVKGHLRMVSERVKSLSSPGNSQKLLTKLKPVNEAIRTDTKIRRLIRALEDIDLRDLVFNEDLPRRRTETPQTARRKTRKPTPRPGAEQEALAIVSIFITVAVTVAVGLGMSTSIGWLRGLLAGVALAVVITGAVAVARPLWLRALGRRRRRT